jgi:hypothetical protein
VQQKKYRSGVRLVILSVLITYNQKRVIVDFIVGESLRLCLQPLL